MSKRVYFNNLGMLIDMETGHVIHEDPDSCLSCYNIDYALFHTSDNSNVLSIGDEEFSEIGGIKFLQSYSQTFLCRVCKHLYEVVFEAKDDDACIIKVNNIAYAVIKFESAFDKIVNCVEVGYTSKLGYKVIATALHWNRFESSAYTIIYFIFDSEGRFIDLHLTAVSGVSYTKGGASSIVAKLSILGETAK